MSLSLRIAGIRADWCGLAAQQKESNLYFSFHTSCYCELDMKALKCLSAVQKDGVCLLGVC